MPRAEAESPMSRLFHWPLALLFLFSGCIKLFSFPQFAQAVGEFGIVFDRFVKPTAVSVCVVELGVAFALWQQKTWAMLATGVLLVGFLGVLSDGVAIGLDIECGCFGSGYKLKLRQQLGVDIILLLWCVLRPLFLKRNHKEEKMHNVHLARGFVLAAVTAVSVGCVGCGTNKFEQEVTIEASSVKFAREAITGQYPILSTPEVKKLLDEGTACLLLDAMPAGSSFDEAHIPGAVNFEFPKEPMKDWTEESMPGRTKEAYQKLLGDDLDRLIVVYCGFVKCARSHNAVVFAKELGYMNVQRYAGGIYAWRGAGLSVESD